MNKNIKLIAAIILLFAYGYVYYLCLWGKILYGETGNVGYIIACHILAIVNYFSLDVITEGLRIRKLSNRNELFFLLHGSLISVLPYNGYLLAGVILMAAALIASAVRK